MGIESGLGEVKQLADSVLDGAGPAPAAKAGSRTHKAVMGLPLLVRTARAGFEQVDRRYEHVASTLGANPFRVFLTVTLPLALPSVMAAAVLCFARAIGEFGATMMIAGSIPGSTRTLAVAIYSFAETGRDTQAAQLVLVSAAIAFAALALSNWITARSGLRA